jgi:Ca2+-binding RTX toxin-like protein
MKTILRHLPLVGLALGLSAQGAPGARAAPFPEFYSPFGATVPVRVGLGTVGDSQLLIYQNKLTKECHTRVVGDGEGLWYYTLDVHGSDAEAASFGAFDDEITFVGRGQMTFECAGSGGSVVTLTPIILGAGYALHAWGHAGRDYIVGTGVPSILYGQAGNDRLVGDDLRGDEGDDTLMSGDANASRETMSGGPGNDCFVDSNRTALTIRGGDGHDVVVSTVSAHMEGIEEIVTSCPIR